MRNVRRFPWFWFAASECTSPRSRVGPQSQIHTPYAVREWRHMTRRNGIRRVHGVGSAGFLRALTLPAPTPLRGFFRSAGRSVPCLRWFCGASLRAALDAIPGGVRTALMAHPLRFGMLAPKRCKHGTLAGHLPLVSTRTKQSPWGMVPDTCHWSAGQMTIDWLEFVGCGMQTEGTLPSGLSV
jgi:hypothetical protein